MKETNTSLEELRQLYPQLNEEQLREADENLKAYLSLSWRIFERISSDPVQMKKLSDLTRELDQLNNS